MLTPRRARVEVPINAVKRIPSSVSAPTGGTITEMWATECLITVEDDAIRWTVNGSDPTTAIGHRTQETDEPLEFHTSREIQEFRCIACDGSPAAIEITCQ